LSHTPILCGFQNSRVLSPGLEFGCGTPELIFFVSSRATEHIGFFFAFMILIFDDVGPGPKSEILTIMNMGMLAYLARQNSSCVFIS
jgi:hypothetical protein